MSEQERHELLEKLQALEAQIEQTLHESKARFSYEIKHGKAVFTQEIQKLQRTRARTVWRFLRATPLRMFATAPVIYGLLLPALILDACVSFYQWVCFPVYRIARVKRSDYITFDRHRLGYLNVIEKINCAYCSYMNGLFSYVGEIAGRTEQYFCPIKHAKRIKHPHSRYKKFVDYGAFETYLQELKTLRTQLSQEKY